MMNFVSELHRKNQSVDTLPLIQTMNIKKYFRIGKGVFKRNINYVRAVDDVSIDIYPGETLGLVGESGCGKSTLGRVLLSLQNATEGEIIFNGINIKELNSKELRKLRRDMQIIFQNPLEALNPRLTIGESIGEMFKIHKVLRGKELDYRVIELLQMVGLDPSRRNRYPHEFSGGQRQRVGIARAIALNPKFIVADEAVSALDVSVQSQIINLLNELQDKLGLTYLFIAHGLNVVRYISDRVCVMYLGKIVEIAKTDELFNRPAHPYTSALISTMPIPNPHRKSERIILHGEIPSPSNPPRGCRFHTRCPIAKERCVNETPELREVGSGHKVACHFPL